MKTTPAKDPLICNGAALRKANRRVTQLYDAALASSGLGIAQRSILLHIHRAGEPTMTELAKALVMNRSALTHNIKPLERDGYLEQVRDPADARTRRLRLTKAGSRKLDETQARWRKAQSAFETVYGAERAALLRQALSDICSDEFASAFEATIGG